MKIIKKCFICNWKETEGDFCEVCKEFDYLEEFKKLLKQYPKWKESYKLKIQI